MTDFDRRFRLRGLPVIHDTIDNETIAINQQTGRYYSFDGPAAAVWLRLEAGTTATSEAATLAQAYDVTPDAAARAVAGFFDELVGEGLIEPELDDAAGGEPRPRDATPRQSPLDGPPLRDAPEGRRPPLPGLVVHRYTDMEVLLLADPIHEVDETGWPTPLPAPEA